MTPNGFLSNNAGGILGGISTGQDITVSIAIKPTSSIRLDRRTIDHHGPVVINTHGRHDPAWASAPRRLQRVIGPGID